MKTSTLTEAEIQDKVQDFVNREVIYCVSSLVYELTQKQEIHEDFYHLWQGAPSYGEWTCPECGHSFDEEAADKYTREGHLNYIECPECEHEDCSPKDNFQPEEYSEIFEHWIVSDWLADRLESHGETVERDFFGLTIWARSCTGQAIMLDWVIRQIWEDLQIGCFFIKSSH